MRGAAKPDGALPRLVVFDPSDSWGHSMSRVLLPDGVETALERSGLAARVLRVCKADCRESDAVLAVVPDCGFSAHERARLERIVMPPKTHPVFATVVDESMLVEVSRAGFGFEQLRVEVRREHESPLLLLRPDAEEPLIQRALDLLLRMVQHNAKQAHARRVMRQLAETAAALPVPPAPARSMEDLADHLAAVERGRILRGRLSKATRLEREARAEGDHSDTLWLRLADFSRERCLAGARGVEAHGNGAEDVIAGLADLLPEVALSLQENFNDPPSSSFEVWAESVRSALSEPAVLLPIVGVFSSGKTTLINHLLGRTAEGHWRLRTSQNHNTALLTRFHLGSDPELLLTPRSRVAVELLWHGDHRARPVRSPCAGTIERVDRVGEGTTVTIRAKEGRVRWVDLDAKHPPLRSIRPGRPVRLDEALSEGHDESDDVPGLKKEFPRSARLSVRPWATASVLQFLRSGALTDAVVKVRWRIRGAILHTANWTPFVLRDDVHTQGSPDFRRAIVGLEAIVRSREARLLDFVRVPVGDQVPIAVRFEARVNRDHSSLPRKKALDGEAGWSWFQGPPDQRGGVSADPEARGFAESPEAAWLVERADLHLDAPLFRLVSLVDTPGLDSISDHHDQITESCIHEGQAFLVMVRLGQSTFSAAVDRTLDLIVQAMAARGVPRNEWRSRVFVVMNWFKRDGGARTPADARRNANRFRSRLRLMLHGPPRFYVVDLSPSQLMENREELLGYPSLAVLKRDLRGFIGVQGVGARLRGLEQELRSKVTRSEEDLKAEAAGLRTGDKKAASRLERAIGRLAAGEASQEELFGTIDAAVNALTEPLRQLAAELSRDYEDREDFEQAQTVGARCLRAFNEACHRLPDGLDDDLDGLLARLGKPWLAEGTSLRRGSLPEGLKPVAPDTFQQRVSKVLREWPGGWGRFWHAIVNFEFYATTRRRELREEFVGPEFLDAIEAAVGQVRTDRRAAVRENLDLLSSRLRSRARDLRADEKQRKARLEEVEAQSRRLDEFRPAVDRVSATLKRVIAEIDGLGSGRSRT